MAINIRMLAEGMAGRVSIAKGVPAAQLPALAEDTGLKSTDGPVSGAKAA
jgi:hypothetical protein